MRTAIFRYGFLLMFVFVAKGLFAQPCMWNSSGYGGWGPSDSYNNCFNPKAVETVKGTVVSVERISPRQVSMPGIHVLMKTADGVVDVHLGPAWYIENQNIIINPKDRLEVKGSWGKVDGKSVLMAMKLMKGDDVFVLRNGDGFPIWCGWRRHAQNSTGYCW